MTLAKQPEVEATDEEMTRPISIRIGTTDFEAVEAIREVMDERSGIKPARSDIMRKAMRMGIESFCKDQAIDVTAHQSQQRKTVKRRR